MSRLMLMLLLGLALSACRKRAETTASEVRPVTMRDRGLKLDATSQERFGSVGAMPGQPGQAPTAGESPLVAGFKPESWNELPGNSFRLLNYGFGTGGEVSVGLSGGGLRVNVNRWRGQFGLDPLDDSGIAQLEAIQSAGYKGVLFELEGNYSPGMGRPSKEGQALVGVVAEKNGVILTVKMVGPKDEVEAEKEQLRMFAKQLEERDE